MELKMDLRLKLFLLIPSNMSSAMPVSSVSLGCLSSPSACFSVCSALVVSFPATSDSGEDSEAFLEYNIAARMLWTSDFDGGVKTFSSAFGLV